MKIVSVAAPGNGSGKTLTVAAILGAFPRQLSAVKFTTVFRDGVNCPRTERSCACRSLHGRFNIVTDPDVLMTEETDTGRLGRAGARSVLWCLALPGAHQDAWNHLCREFLAREEAIITEGNTVIPVLSPDLLVMVISPRVPRERWKPDSWGLIRRADLVVLNNHEASAAPIDDMAAEIAAVRGGARPLIEDVSRPLANWSDRALRRAVARLIPDRPLQHR